MFEKLVYLVIIVFLQQIIVNGDCDGADNLQKLNCDCINLNSEVVCYGYENAFTIDSPEWDEFENDNNLIELSFGQNFNYLPFHLFSNLTNLELFKMWRLKITTIPSSSFKNMKYLREVWIYNNDVSSVQKHTFVNLPELREVSLYWNKITALDAETFSGVPNLETINLSWNQISEVPRGFFDNLFNLKKLYFEYNQLKYLDLQLMAPIVQNFLKKDSILLLYGHQFFCNCDLYWLSHIYKNTKSEDVKQHINEIVCNVNDASMNLLDYYRTINCAAISIPSRTAITIDVRGIYGSDYSYIYKKIKFE